jgi:hypothetical protein
LEFFKVTLPPVPNKVTTALTNLRKRLRIPAVLCWTIFALFFLYPLSYGPAIWLYRRGYLPSAVGSIYVPLVSVARPSPSLRNILNLYIARWVPPGNEIYFIDPDIIEE